MAIAGIASSSAPAQLAADTGSEYGVKVARKVLDLAAEEGKMLAQMIDNTAGVGRTVNTQA